MNEKRLIDITASELVDMLTPVIREIVRDELKKIADRKPDVFVYSLRELASSLDVSVSTAMNMAKRTPGAAQRLSSRKSRYNVTKIVEHNNRIYS